MFSFFSKRPKTSVEIQMELSSTDPEIRKAASASLMASKDPHLVDTAFRALSDAERVVRCRAAMYLGQMGNSSHAEKLKECWLKEHNEGYGHARAVMHDAIRSITGYSDSQMADMIDEMLARR